jgi:hypothetical protein
MFRQALFNEIYTIEQLFFLAEYKVSAVFVNVKNPALFQSLTAQNTSGSLTSGRLTTVYQIRKKYSSGFSRFFVNKIMKKRRNFKNSHAGAATA